MLTSWLGGLGCWGQGALPVMGPVQYCYASIGKFRLKAYVFSPPPAAAPRPRPGMVLFHGGGWNRGSAEWTFRHARHFASRGLVAVSVDYRLSDQKTITPLEAMADARTAMRWVRAHASMLGIDPKRIAAFGQSAGGHLAACAAIFNDPREYKSAWVDCGARRVASTWLFDDPVGKSSVSCSPDALVLFYPVVDTGYDIWTEMVMLGKADSHTISPYNHIRQGLPPMVILQGKLDHQTPFEHAVRFADRMRAAGNRCELHLFENVGHIFIPAGIPDVAGNDPDPNVEAAAWEKADQFLASLWPDR
jgi:acetyl esterase